MLSPAGAATNELAPEEALDALEDVEDPAEAEDLARDSMQSGAAPMTTDSPDEEFELAEQLDPHVSVNHDTGHIEFDADGAIQSGVDPEHVEETAAAYDEYNESFLPRQTPQCQGNEGYHFTWRANYDLNSCTVNGIVGALAAGAGVSGIAALFPGPHSVAMGVAAGVMAVGGGWLTYLNRHGCGVTLSYPPLWGSSQCA